ncbi:MAG: C1 family peptidase [Paludibacteraceae bacterium]|nr:C1 family peptidase [Paludibacteraceae bacterium]
MLKFFRTRLIIPIMALSTLSVSTTSCDDETSDALWEIIEAILSMLGWDFESENVQNQDKADVYDETTDGDLSSSVSLERYFPPIGDQGSYGTCVAWATGYAMKTSLNAKQNNWTSSQLSQASNQTSPVDLWHLIGKDGKSTGCNGSNFEPAMDAIKAKGCASMAQKPFTNKKMTCDGVTGTGSSSNKLGQYRVIAYNSEMGNGKSYGMSVSNFKYWLDQGYPVLIGAELGEKFMSWSSSSVITSDTKGYQGQHAYHAMVVVGYDDSKSAFRVRNSWDTNWGDNGSIWVGYSHFINQFCFGGWIATNPGQTLPSAAPAKMQSALRSSYQADLAAHIVADYENADGSRTLEYNIINEGSSILPASKKWSVVYMLYERKDLSKHYVLMHDYYGTEVANGQIAQNNNGLASLAEGSTVTNVSIAAGSSAAEALGGKVLTFNYNLPNDENGEALNGKYYLVLMVNSFGDYNDTDMENNYSFVSAGEEPLEIVNGKIVNMPSTLTDVRSLITEKNWNTYSGVELNNMLVKHDRNGKLKAQVQSESLRATKKIAKKVK